jgi:hypothetical protein
MPDSLHHSPLEIVHSRAIAVTGSTAMVFRAENTGKLQDQTENNHKSRNKARQKKGEIAFARSFRCLGRRWRGFSRNRRDVHRQIAAEGVTGKLARED